MSPCRYAHGVSPDCPVPSLGVMKTPFFLMGPCLFELGKTPTTFSFMITHMFIHSYYRSFGDYFKEGAIDMAWQCLTQEFGLDPERIYATYFGGNDDSPCDTQARNLWLKYLPQSRVLPFDEKDNFWEMGATGPCGPCTVSAVLCERSKLRV